MVVFKKIFYQIEEILNRFIF